MMEFAVLCVAIAVSAATEVLWTGPGRRAFTDFSRRVRSVAERLRGRGLLFVLCVWYYYPYSR